ncbi:MULTISPECIES: hypothetical protein [unclassified Anabaena]|uniref:hypothetical protein n=1 Tax=unclassified Anabaena TaxID=2619674 RepID=UPI0014476F61|nr:MULTISPECIES: hypothetical protein [unclassified Anabaena]MTJ10046.1 hypothetical protein [Anabaena sp. UHCC 0204]MTJ55481.1 hypothetical protein [Anabaena sp. UHCC 0253]
MKKTIGLGLMVLSVYLCNSSACFAGNKLSVSNTQLNSVNDAQLQLVANVSARDDQTGDCLRRGNCRD